VVSLREKGVDLNASTSTFLGGRLVSLREKGVDLNDASKLVLNNAEAVSLREKGVDLNDNQESGLSVL